MLIDWAWNCMIMSRCSHRFPWLSLAICFYHPLLPAGLPDYILCPYRAVVDKFLLASQHSHINVKGLIRKHSLWVCPYFSSSILHVCLIWMVLEMGGKCLYSCCFVGCCFQDLFNIACRILVQFPSSFFNISLVSVHVVHL